MCGLRPLRTWKAGLQHCGAAVGLIVPSADQICLLKSEGGIVNMTGRSDSTDFERLVDDVSRDLIEVIRAHIAQGTQADAVLEALAAVLGTTIASTADSVDELERNLEIATLRIQQSSDDAFVHGASNSGGLA